MDPEEAEQLKKAAIQIQKDSHKISSIERFLSSMGAEAEISLGGIGSVTIPKPIEIEVLSLLMKDFEKSVERQKGKIKDLIN